jgi:hypothetical protein
MRVSRLLVLSLSLLLSAMVSRAQQQQPITWTTQPVIMDGGPDSWVRMVQLPDGSWLAAYAVEISATYIVLQRSYDSMRTWQQVSRVAEAGRDLDNPMLALAPDGTVIMAVRSEAGASSFYIETYQSSDDGNSFQFQSQVVSDQTLAGVYEPFLYFLPNGTLACFYANEEHALETPSYSQTVSEQVSQDGGNTWGPEIIAIGQPGALRAGEPNLVPLPGGVLALFFEVCGTENCIGHISYSTDGVTWGGIGPALPDTFQDIQGVALQDGLIFATSNLLHVIMSADYTNSWTDTREYPFLFGSWPNLYQTSPTEMAMALTSGGPNGAQGVYIQFGTINASALQPVTSVNTCRNPTLTRPQNCY